MNPLDDARIELHKLRTSLDSEFDRYGDVIAILPMGQLRLQEDLRRYLCIRCAGFLEQAFHIVLTAHVKAKSPPTVANFALHGFSHSPNLGSGPMVRLLGRFGAKAEQDIAAFLAQKRRKDILDDLLSVRNDVAHGKHSNGQKVQPAPYQVLCHDLSDWLSTEYL